MSVSRYRLEWFGPEKYGRRDGMEVTVFGTRARRYEDFTAEEVEFVADELGQVLLRLDNPVRRAVIERFGEALMGISDTIRQSGTSADPPS